MNTSAIPTSPLPSTAVVSKSQSSDSTTPDVPFNQVLTREVADRHAAENAQPPKTKDLSGANTKKESSRTNSNNSAEDKNSNEYAGTPETDANSTAEQLLMMAAQFSPAIPPTSAASAAQNAATSASISLTAEAGNILNATQSTGLQVLDKPEIVAIEDNSGTTNTADLKSAGFDATLSQILDKNHGQDAAINNEQNSLTGALQQQESLAAKIAEKLIPSTPNQPAVELSSDKNIDTQAVVTAALAPMQQALVNQAQNAAGHSSNRLTPQVGTPAWNQSVGQKLVWMIGNEQQSASLTLNPPDLGPLQVVLSVSSTQANASFYASQPEVRQALEAALPRLREMLGEAGIQLGQANVSAGTPQHQGSYSEQQASSRSQSHGSDGATSAARVVTNSTRIVRDGLIDTFA